MTTALTQSSIWRALTAHFDKIQSQTLCDLFARDALRFEQFSIEINGLLADFSKNPITQETLDLLINLANSRHVPDAISALFEGRAVNTTESRPALHTALRDPSPNPIIINNHDIKLNIQSALEHMFELSAQLRAKKWLGATGEPIEHIVNLGIGGSDLGPRLVAEALGGETAKQPLSIHFVANIDAHDIQTTLSTLNPARTLFIIASKSFTTRETLLNAKTARAWLSQSGIENHQPHLIAVTANQAAAHHFGIIDSHILPLWDWVGGRYSVWSTVGFSALCAIGEVKFKDLLKGAHDLDNHFKNTPLEKNLPVLLGLIDIWHYDFYHCNTHAILPYAERLKHFPNYLKQLAMESNGKSVNYQGQTVQTATCPIIWGEVGCNGQHAFHQLLHQGTTWGPIDFIVACDDIDALPEHRRLLFANCISQSLALMRGKNKNEIIDELVQAGVPLDKAKQLAPHRVLPGNKSSTTIVLPTLSPYYLGMLLALYEHKTYVKSVIWGINAFDQMGVEFGKTCTQLVEQAIETDNHAIAIDSSTKGLINQYRAYASKKSKISSPS